MENISDFLVKNPKQILQYLKTLATEKCLLSASFGDNYSFLTAILEIDSKKQVITIDCGPKEYLNKELLSQGIVNCKADILGIKVLFEGREVKKSGNTKQTALSIKIPDSIYWIQRRQFYRVRSPLSKDSYCLIQLQKSPSTESESHRFKLYDLSATGFSLLSETLLQAAALCPSAEFKNCQLVLEDLGSLNISFIVKSRFPFNGTKPTKSQRIGCEFINPSTNIESSCLRYMQDIERLIKRNQK